MPKKKIDIVYLWVDGADKKWRAEKDKWFKKINGVNPIYKGAADVERFRDNGEFLYSLRSVAECVPWINHIYIITGFNQVPKWLNTNHPKITIIPHEQIIPAHALPTFNATSIEMCIPNIKELSEHFLLMNDDIFFNKKISPDFFFNRRGQTIVRYNSYTKHPSNINKWIGSVDDYTQTLILSSKILEDTFDKKLYFGRPSHGVDPYLKTSIKECMNIPQIKKQINNQVSNKFRTNTEIQRWTFNLYDFIKKRAIFKHARARKYTRHKILNFIYNTLHFIGIRNSNVVCTNVTDCADAISRAPTFCINDASDNTPEILKKNREFLEQRFPNKCEFEK